MRHELNRETIFHHLFWFWARHKRSEKRWAFLTCPSCLSVITSSSTRDYVVTLPDGSRETRRYQWRETISFNGCYHSETLRDMKPTQMLSVDHIFAIYDPAQRLIRFALTSKIGDINGEKTFSFSCLWFELTSFLRNNVLTERLFLPDRLFVAIVKW